MKLYKNEEVKEEDWVSGKGRSRWKTAERVKEIIKVNRQGVSGVWNTK